MSFSFRSGLRPVSVLPILLFACESTEERRASPSTSRDAREEQPSLPKDASPVDAGSDAAVEPEPELDLPTTDAGCLAWAAAEQVCGVDSDEEVCELAVSCGASSDLGTCKINCEMQTTVNCFSNADAQCLIDAVKAKSCSKLSACKWKP